MFNNKKIMITGITGMVGSTIAKECLDKGNVVIGMVRRTSNNSLGRLKKSNIVGHQNLILSSGDLTDYSSLDRIIKGQKPDIIINCGASSHVGESFKTPLENMQITGAGCANLLEAVRNNKSEYYDPYFIQFSTSEMFGGNFSREVLYDQYNAVQHFNVKNVLPDSKGVGFFGTSFQNENTPLSANSPYAAAKIYAHNMVELYREAYGLKTISLIAFNMEGSTRGETFVTRKITKYVAELNNYIQTAEPNALAFPKLRLGNIDAMRDWTHVHDSIQAIPILIDGGNLGTYCVCSNQTHTVREFIEGAFSFIKIDKSRCMDYITIDPAFFRPCEVPFLRGDSSKLRKLGWAPKVSFYGLIAEMVFSDISEGDLV